MTATASLITSLTIVCSTVYSSEDQRKHQSSASLAFVRGLHRKPVNSAQMASNAENVSIWWRHHDIPKTNKSECVMLNTRLLWCLMEADDIFLLSDSSLGMQNYYFYQKYFVKKIQLSIKTRKTKVITFNKRFSKGIDFTRGDNKIEVVKTHTYLGIEIIGSFSESFKLAINRYVDNASKAYITY